MIIEVCREVEVPDEEDCRDCEERTLLHCHAWNDYLSVDKEGRLYPCNPCLCQRDEAKKEAD